jgi:hypothetical protein
LLPSAARKHRHTVTNPHTSRMRDVYLCALLIRKQRWLCKGPSNSDRLRWFQLGGAGLRDRWQPLYTSPH